MTDIYLWSTAVPTGADVWLRDPTQADAGVGAATGTFAAVESGLDVAALTGTAPATGLSGSLAATESGSDTAASGTLTFAEGETTKNVTVSIAP